MDFNYREPVYTIGVVSGMLKVCPATLRIWEKKGLVEPQRLGKNRFYSRCDVDRLEHVKKLLQEKHLNIEGVKTVLATSHCWEIKKCNTTERAACSFYRKYGP